MKWTTKALIQRALAAVPAGHIVYYLGQRSLGGLRHFTIDSKVTQGVSLLRSLFDIGEDVEGVHAVEIGTGWAPVVPLLFWAYGQRRCDTYDVSALLKDHLVLSTVDQLTQRKDPVLAATADPTRRERVTARLRQVGALAAPQRRARDILDACGIHYHGPADAARTALADRSVDLVYSNVVLEHVPPPEIDRLFREAYRILRPNACMVHLIDPSDHFAHSDASISPINFLRFSDAEFVKYNSVFLFQNRLRAPTWRHLIERHGFQISYWRRSIDQQALECLSTLGIDEAFAPMTPEDLCTTAIWVVARRPASQTTSLDPVLTNRHGHSGHRR
jgi:SAM-dependent methyltransferase